MKGGTLDQRFATAMGQLLGPGFPPALALAVSGGGDSMAMLALAHNWSRSWGVDLSVVTIDHGLRTESLTEARMVAEFCAGIGRPHDILTWKWDGTGNVQDAARRARLSLIDAWRGKIAHVLMAHTADDQAETFLMRLARGSGVDGLSGMAAKREVPGSAGAKMTVVRPCLDMGRDELRQYIKVLQVPWVDDPSNDDVSYDRVRMRQALPVLEDLGISRDGLLATATRMARAGEALRARVKDVAEDLCGDTGNGMLSIDRDGFAQIEPDTRMRLLAAGCMWVGGAEYRPRAHSLESLLDQLLAGGGGTLTGVQAMTVGGQIRLFREFSAVRDLSADAPGLWDNRWKLIGDGSGLTVRALGEAVSDCPDWRTSGQPRAALLASPAIWKGKSLIAAPLAGLGQGWDAQIVTDFKTWLELH